MRKTIIGMMGGAAASEKDMAQAEDLGRSIAENGWTLLTGGRPSGIMLAASRGASSAGGLVVGVLYGADPDEANQHVDLAIATDMADARNLINVLSSDVVVACPGSTGTLCEVALAAKRKRPLVLFGFEPGPTVPEGPLVRRVGTTEEAMAAIKAFVAARRNP